MRQFAIQGSRSTTTESDMTKAYINKLVAENSNQKRDKVAVVLDGRKRMTTKALLKAGWCKSRIFIPNSSNDYASIKRWHMNTYKMTLNEFLTNHKNDHYRIGTLYADYMCSLFGGQECRPKEDITILFENHMLAYGASLGITINLRTREKCKVPLKNHDIPMVIKFIQDTAHDNGYRAKLIDGGSYINGGGPGYTMFSAVFKIKKR